MRYTGYQSQSRLQNQIVIVALSNGEVILKAPYEPHPSVLLTYQTNLGNIIDISAPPSANLEDSSFFAALNEDGKLKIFNYTILDSVSSHARFARDYFRVRLGANTSRPLEETLGGQKMIDQGYPFKYTKPL